MKIVIAGGSGFIGQEIARKRREKGDEIVVLTRGKSEVAEGIQYVNWDAKTESDWTTSLEGSQVLINLTGKSVDCRHTEKNKKAILNSRVDATNILNTAISKMAQKPKVWLNASAATIYKYSFDTAMTEENTDYGNDFSKDVALSWENAFYSQEFEGLRKVALRITVVVGETGGVYPVLRRLTKFGLGGKAGDGKQKFAWIEIGDFTRIVDFVIENENIHGPVNCGTINTPTNAEFMRAMRKSLNIPFGIPQPTFILKLGALIIGTESDLMLKSRFVYPKKLVDNGFKFNYETCEKALDDLSK